MTQPATGPSGPRAPDILRPPRTPPAAARGATRGAVSELFTLTLLSAVDGSLLALAASGQLESLGGAVAVGLTVVAGAGSWLAAREAFRDGIRGRRDWAVLGLLAVVTAAATVGCAWLGASLGQALTLHVLPKVAGLVLFLVAAEVAGLRLPRPMRLPLPALVLAAGLAVEVAAQWIP